jgi:hypothetical protein
MKKGYIYWIIIVPLLLILVICGIVIKDFTYNPYGYPDAAWQPEQGSFFIDPKTILMSLENGETDVFTPNLGQVDGEVPDVVFEGAINWKPSEFMMITEALNRKVWKDNLDDWQLYDMVFFMDCQDNPGGFERGFMTYFKTISYASGEKVYTVRDFSIMPRNTYVEWGGGADYPRTLFGWKSIDLDKLRVDAMDALGIAEENGGKNYRLKSNNECRITLSLMPEMYKNWDVTYSIENSPEFSITIDPFTGEIKSIWSSDSD